MRLFIFRVSKAAEHCLPSLHEELGGFSRGFRAFHYSSTPKCSGPSTVEGCTAPASGGTLWKRLHAYGTDGALQWLFMYIYFITTVTLFDPLPKNGDKGSGQLPLSISFNTMFCRVLISLQAFLSTDLCSTQWRLSNI